MQVAFLDSKKLDEEMDCEQKKQWADIMKNANLQFLPIHTFLTKKKLLFNPLKF